MTLIAPNRQMPISEDDGTPTPRFASIMEDVVSTINALVTRRVNKQDTSYTFVDTDELMIVRKTSDTAQQVYTIPSNAEVPFDIGTVLEVQNDGSVSITVAINDDTMTSEAGLGAGTRTIGPDGSGRFVKVADKNWKARGEQMT